MIIGASKLVQLEDNLRSVEFGIPHELRMKLDKVSALQPGHPYDIFNPGLQGRISGGTSVYPWAPLVFMRHRQAIRECESARRQKK